MRNDQIFVLLLVVLLPMSGCFDGGGVGEAEGSQDSTDSSGTTVVNHYYNNTTTIIESNPEYYVTSGFYGNCGQWTNTTSNGSTSSVCNSWEYPQNEYVFIDIPANTTVRIHGVSSSQGALNYFSVTCASGFEITSNLIFGAQYTTGMVATDGTDCSLVGNGASRVGSWSIVYEVIDLNIV